LFWNEAKASDESVRMSLGLHDVPHYLHGVEVTEWCGGVVASLHGELIEVDGGFVEVVREFPFEGDQV
jgi:hypothetical protein